MLDGTTSTLLLQGVLHAMHAQGSKFIWGRLCVVWGVSPASKASISSENPLGGGQTLGSFNNLEGKR